MNRWIADTNCLIYLGKAKSLDVFHELVNGQMVIDTSVYSEAVEEGIDQGYMDALEIKTFLETRQVPIIPVDISNDLHDFKDRGETSCYLLGKEDGTCITSDTRANKKFREKHVASMQLDTFFFHVAKAGQISIGRFETIMNALERLYATTPERKYEMLMKIKEGVDRE
nr:hypothetical protein [Candidatus Sigynarchaeota archaeon]